MDPTVDERPFDLVDISMAVRRFVASRVRDPHDVDDLVQETMARTIAARKDLDEDTAVGYSITVARHLIASMQRDADVARRHAPKLIDLREPPRPDVVLLADEERRALAAALAGLPVHQQRALLAHEVDGDSLADVAGSGQAPAALAAQLSRARARLRVDYVLALRALQLPTSACRPVLLALSAGDKRRQQATAAGAHLLTCSTCSEVTPALLERRRVLAGYLPWVALGAPHGALTKWVRSHPLQSTGAAAGTAVAIAAAVALLNGPTEPPAPSRAGPVSSVAVRASPSTAAPVDDIPGLRSGGGGVNGAPAAVAAVTGRRVVATRTPVQSVPADEGFWVGASPTNRVWVQLTTTSESRVTVRAGAKVSFVGQVVANRPGFISDVGLSRDEDVGQLRRQGSHVRVDAADLTVDP